VDAPCSGLGVLRREPDIRWRRSAGDLPGLAAIGASILGHAARVVRPGGRLVYATCSSEPDENEAVVEAFLAASPPFRVADPDHVRRLLPPAAADLVDGRGCLQTWPWRDDLEAFFGAVLIRSA
jgi:16S rRNA (cytosine967-C5)-methyltransferase